MYNLDRYKISTIGIGFDSADCGNLAIGHYVSNVYLVQLFILLGTHEIFIQSLQAEYK